MERTKAEVEKEILSFLDEKSTKKGDPSLPGCGSKHGTPCALGTLNKNITPRVTPIDFRNDGLTLWMVGDPGKKLANIRSNPNVSVAIFHPLDHSKENRSIMLEGKASVITKRKQEQLYMDVIMKLGILDSFKQAIRVGLIEKRAYSKLASGEDLESKLEKLIDNIALIKVEPEIISLQIIQPDGTQERLIWKKEE